MEKKGAGKNSKEILLTVSPNGAAKEVRSPFPKGYVYLLTSAANLNTTNGAKPSKKVCRPGESSAALTRLCEGEAASHITGSVIVFQDNKSITGLLIVRDPGEG